MPPGEIYAPVTGPACFLISSSRSRTSLSFCMTTQQQQHSDFTQSVPKLPSRRYSLLTLVLWIAASIPVPNLAFRTHHLRIDDTHIEIHKQQQKAHMSHYKTRNPISLLDPASATFVTSGTWSCRKPCTDRRSPCSTVYQAHTVHASSVDPR